MALRTKIIQSIEHTKKCTSQGTVLKYQWLIWTRTRKEVIKNTGGKEDDTWFINETIYVRHDSLYLVFIFIKVSGIKWNHY